MMKRQIPPLLAMILAVLATIAVLCGPIGARAQDATVPAYVVAAVAAKDRPQADIDRDAARNAVVPTQSAANAGYANQDHNREWEQKLEAFRLCRNSTGYRARKEGWLVAMFDFCREYGRTPMGREIDICIEQARASVEGMEECRGTPLYSSLVALRKAMIARREKEIFGELSETAA